MDEGEELESVLEKMGINPNGLASQRREQLAASELPEEPDPRASTESYKSEEEGKKGNGEE
jgi:hypothetical protein